MSTLEKFGILVILILVVIIGVVAVWGVGGDGASPFDPADAVATDPAAPGGSDPPWPDALGGSPAPASEPGANVAPPPVGTGLSPAAGPAALAPAAEEDSFYVVKKGDTLAGIAAATLGDKNKWKLIVDANPGLDPRRLKVGAKVRIPGPGRGGPGASGAMAGTPPVLPPRTFAEPRPNPADGPTEVQPAPAGSPGREVEVRAGDTLYEISRRELGDPNLYYKLIEANPGIDPKRLRKGMRIRLPAAQ